VSRVIRPASRQLEQKLRHLAERTLTLEEWRAQLQAPLRPDEQENMRALIRWFRRRYPTPAERLAYARRAYARWTAVPV
jgi:hypothetical protein